MQRAADLDRLAWTALVHAFYGLVHHDPQAWGRLAPELKETDVGVLCARYVETGDPDLLEEIGERLGGKDWYVVLGRTF